MALSRLDNPLRFIPFRNTNISHVTNSEEFGRLASEDMRDMPELAYALKTIEESVLGVWGEGIAEYLTARANLYFRYGFFGSVNDELRFLQSKGKRLAPVAALIDKGLRPPLDIRKIMMNYQEIHSYVEYIVENYGWTKLYEAAADGSGDEAFMTAFGTDRAGFHERWLEWLASGE
jgi:hypothetical protein